MAQARSARVSKIFIISLISTKTNFEFSGPYSRLRPAKSTNQCVLTERYDNVSYGFSFFFTGDLWPARFALRVKIEGRRGGKTRRHFRQSDVARVILGCGIRGDHYF